MSETGCALTWREKIHEVIFEAETPLGRGFDVLLLVAIILSLAVVMLDSVESIHNTHGTFLVVVEWVFTVLFSVEYLLRIISVRRPLGYVFSLFGFVDLLSILPTYLTLIGTGSASFSVVRVLRLLRVFRVLKLAHFLGEARVLQLALRDSRNKITVFLGFVFCIVVIMGALMYLIEGREHGFSSIPQGMYWAIVTLTTVGYGDISPETPLGKLLASCLMILGYAVLAVPTGIFSAELIRHRGVSTEACPECCHEGHDIDAKNCKFCGAQL